MTNANAVLANNTVLSDDPILGEIRSHLAKTTLNSDAPEEQKILAAEVSCAYQISGLIDALCVFERAALGEAHEISLDALLAILTVLRPLSVAHIDALETLESQLKRVQS